VSVTEDFSGGRKSAGAEIPVVRRSVSVNVTDAVTQSITDDVGMSMQTIQAVLRVWKRELLGPRGCLGSERALLNIELDAPGAAGLRVRVNMVFVLHVHVLV
jgi:hypothetical protein